MWLIMFAPVGSSAFVPQLLCRDEQEARNWIKNAPISVVGSYAYMYVPIATIGNLWVRQESWQEQYSSQPYQQWQHRIDN